MVTCYFCGLRSSMGDAIDTGWLPSFTVNGDDTGNPVCPACQITRLVYSEEFGEYELNGPDPVAEAVRDIGNKYTVAVTKANALAIADAYRAGFQAAERERRAATDAAKL